jgi:hypothetical protein
MKKVMQNMKEEFNNDVEILEKKSNESLEMKKLNKLKASLVDWIMLKKEYQSLKTRLMYYNMQMKIKGKNTKDV